MFPLLSSKFQFLATALGCGERAMISWQNINNFWPVLWIRSGFNADPDQALYLNAIHTVNFQPYPWGTLLKILDFLSSSVSLASMRRCMTSLRPFWREKNISRPNVRMFPLNFFPVKIYKNFLPVLWIRLGFNADPDPDPGSQTHCGFGSGSWSDFKIARLNFYMKNILKVCNW